MKLAAKIFAALALALAISYVANWSQAPDASAATGKIDVLNVGTCYATSASVFTEGNCKDNVDDEDGEYNLDTGSNAGIQGLGVTTQPYATYAVDPKTSAEEPRGILQDADLLKISIADTGRDKRTPVLLRAGRSGAEDRVPTGASATATSCYDGNEPEITPRDAGNPDGLDREICEVYRLINGDATTKVDDLIDFALTQSFVKREAGEIEVEYSESRASNQVIEVAIPAGEDEDFLPLHRKFKGDGTTLSDDTDIRYFGYVINSAGGAIGSCTKVTVTVANDVPGMAAPLICDLSPYIKFDEDIGAGATKGELPDPDSHSAPYISFGTQLATGDTIRLRYVYYETSQREDIIGGRSSIARGSGEIQPAGVYPADTPTPVFTNDESGEQPDPLLLEAVGDGVTRSQNLWLKETGRFTGRYEGYLRLTDANGDTVETGTTNEDNWGREVGHADASSEEGAAVLGVQGGPVNIRYRDSDGITQTLRILIDTQPPLILIDSPDYKTNFDEQRIRVSGTFSDAGSGLRDDSFRLYVDNSDDDDEDGEKDGTPVLNLPVDGSNTDGGAVKAAGYVTPAVSGGVVQLTGDYIGYADEDAGTDDTRGLFGVLQADWLYKPLEVPVTNDEDEEVGTRDALREIDPDAYADGDSEGTFDDIARLNIQDFSGESVDDLNNQVDFQALVLDLAGNVGFSDSDPTGPTFIHDYGTKTTDRKQQRYNVLGWYSRHIISIDQVDPRLGRVVTGFYDEDDDDEALVNTRGLMLIFDAAVDSASVDANTFNVQLDAVGGADPVDAVVADATTIGKTVYLLLADELLPDATPKLSVNRGRTVRDPAGNSLTSNDSLDGTETGDREIEANDGIQPTLTLTLSSGSGTGTGQEDATNLTKESIVVRITSNEDIQGAPNIAFVCDGFTWIDRNSTPENTSDDVTRDLNAFVNNRKGKQTNSDIGSFEPTQSDLPGDCGDDGGTDLTVTTTPAYSRPGNTWEYQWRNPGESQGTSSRLPDGNVTAVAFGRDTSDWRDDYDPDDSTAGEQAYNWGAATAEFELDTRLEDPSTSGTEFGTVQPGADSEIFESRPFVLLTFTDASTVMIDSFKIDGTAQEITTLPNNRFLYWPESLDFGKHKVEVEAVDAAANERNFSYEFNVKQRTAFTVELLAGWNAVSVPAMPIDPDISSVFTIEQVDQVVGWDSATPNAPWRIATKVDGIWSTDADNAPLDTIIAGKGYWVHANGFVDQTVMLAGNPDRESAGNAPAGPIGITTVKGWNFVGVVDTDGDQTQDGDFGEMLKDSKQEMVTADSYLRNYKQAYTWDPIKNQFNVIEDNDGMSIGDGVWVYYAEGFNIAP